jgi:hypothetical protein
MRKIMAVVLLIGLALDVRAVALGGPEVEYVNGTAPGVKEGTTGTLDTSAPEALEFRSGTAQFSVPYGAVRAYKYREEYRFRLGVLPAIAVGLLKARAKRHFVTVTWKTAEGTPEVATLAASKEDALGLLTVLHARAPQACAVKMGPGCASSQ